MIFEVVQKDDGGVHIRSSYPWGSSEWKLVLENDKGYLTAYGSGNSGLMPLSDRPLYLDFTRRAGESYTNRLGTFTIRSRTAVVQAGSETFRDCLQIQHRTGKTSLFFTFAPGIGYVQFGEGKSAFVLDRSASTLPGRETSPGRAAEPLPSLEGRPLEPARPRPVEPARPTASRGSVGVPIGLTPNTFANEPLSVDTMTRRVDQTVEAGATFMLGNGKWAELEPKKGQYALDSVRQFMSFADARGLDVSFTLRVIDTNRRDVPSDLRRESWSSPKMRARVLSLIDALAPVLSKRTRWFMFGYELDAYLSKNPREVEGFVELHRLATARIKELLPGVKVGATLEFAGAGQLEGSLSGLNRQLDFVAFTYVPVEPDFTVQDPSVLPSDFRRMKQVASGRKILLQEIGYPSAAANRSSQDKQAEFYRLALRELRSDPSAFAAVNFMMLADLSDHVVDQFAGFYGLKTPAFKGMLQSMGVFDGNGKPKKSWNILRDGSQR